MKTKNMFSHVDAISKRSFQVIDVRTKNGRKTTFKEGRYISSTPIGAAKKAFTKICGRRKKLRISLRETTQGSNKKEFTYKISREKLKKPVVRFSGTPNEFQIKYKIQAKSFKRNTYKSQRGGSCDSNTDDCEPAAPYRTDNEYVAEGRKEKDEQSHNYRNNSTANLEAETLRTEQRRQTGGGGALFGRRKVKRTPDDRKNEKETQKTKEQIEAEKKNCRKKEVEMGTENIGDECFKLLKTKEEYHDWKKKKAEQWEKDQIEEAQQLCLERKKEQFFIDNPHYDLGSVKTKTKNEWRCPTVLKLLEPESEPDSTD